MTDLPPDFILDAHLDIAFNALVFRRDFKQSAWRKRQIEGKFPGHPYDEIGVATVGLPDLMLSRTGIIFATIWVSPPGVTPPHTILGQDNIYTTPHEAYRKGLQQMDYYQRLADENANLQIIKTQADLDAVLETWQPGKQIEDHRLGMVILMEGADPVLEPQQVEEWYERGVRVIGPAWRGTRYSGGTMEPGRLTKLGHELLGMMADLNMILDLSHAAEQAYLEMVDAYPGTTIASHSNPRRFVDTDRQLSDTMIRLLMERDGVMGIVPFNQFLKQGWMPGRDRKDDVILTTVVDAIDHVCQIAGDARHVGIGTDWDGTFGWESIPVPLDTHIDLWLLRDALRERFGESDVQQIMAGNFLRKLREGLPK